MNSLSADLRGREQLQVDLNLTVPTGTADLETELRNIYYALDTSSILVVTDAKGVITYVNKKFCDISQYPREELLGETHRKVNSGYHPKEFFQEMWKTIASGRVWTGEIRNRAKDGSFYWVDTTIVPFLDDAGRPFRYVAIRRDITDKKSYLEELERRRAVAMHAEKMAALGEMAAGIAHEIGNPMGAIRGRMEMLEMKAQKSAVTNEDVLATSSRVIGLIDRITRIVRGLRSYARDASQDPLQTIALNRLVADILEISADRCGRHNVDLRVSGLMNDVFVQCREAEIGQVIVNLVNNAVDAIQRLPIKWVSVDLSVHFDQTILTVEDSGPGIPEDIRQQLFSPFFTTKAPGEGTGLGLSIARNIIEAHHGKIGVDETSAHTRFVVSLPTAERSTKMDS